MEPLSTAENALLNVVDGEKGHDLAKAYGEVTTAYIQRLRYCTVYDPTLAAWVKKPNYDETMGQDAI